MTMDDKAYKQAVQQRMKGIPGVAEVFQLIKDGAPRHEVDARVDSLIQAHSDASPNVIEYNPKAASYTVFGRGLIDVNAIEDMDTIMRLPFVKDGALMPDAHRTAEGHTPVGSVVRTQPNIIVPDIVSADIACSVTITVFSADWDEKLRPKLEELLRTKMFFGASSNPDPVGKTRPFYSAFPELKSHVGQHIEQRLRAMAVSQFGTSGDGNHFGEFGLTNKGKLAFLTHYGSRGVGALIHEEFDAWAKRKVATPNGANTYLDTTTPEGADYAALLHWTGEFTYDSHEWLSGVMGAAIGTSRQNLIHSRHNFAWLDEKTGGWIHRKGATPVARGQEGVIPATMGHKTKMVQGLGNPSSLNSTSHGSGRIFSRSKAIKEFGSSTKEYVAKTFGITLIGADADEDPRAYKSIDEVMAAQRECATVVGEFTPKVVRMADPRPSWQSFKKKK